MIAHLPDMTRKRDKIEHMQAVVNRIDRAERWRPRRVVEREGKLRVIDAETGEYAEVMDPKRSGCCRVEDCDQRLESRRYQMCALHMDRWRRCAYPEPKEWVRCGAPPADVWREMQGTDPVKDYRVHRETEGEA